MRWCNFSTRPILFVLLTCPNGETVKLEVDDGTAAAATATTELSTVVGLVSGANAGVWTRAERLIVEGTAATLPAHPKKVSIVDVFFDAASLSRFAFVDLQIWLPR